ncbi:MAG TPA: hypothetical protein VKK79_06070 [Candidatus Lokiarchaeia archaeon]|nr:hypothetical protein [Candidatus Lokiarchaeia archaeon]
MSVSSKESKPFGKKLPWLLGRGIRIPRIRLPEMSDRTFTLPTSPRTIAMGLVYVFLFFVMMGAVYLMTPQIGQSAMPALGADSSGNPVWLYPSINSAFILESIAAAAILFMGGAGFILLFESTKYSLNPGYGRRLLVIGLVLGLTAFIVMQYIIKVKNGS